MPGDPTVRMRGRAWRVPARTVLAALGIGAAIIFPVVVSACGDGADKAGSKPPATAVGGAVPSEPTVVRSPPAPFSIRDAAAFRDRLLELAGKAKWDTAKVTEGYGAFAEWRARYPTLGIYTPASPADQLRISVYVETLFVGGVAAPANPYLIAFAVADAGGRCAAGSILGFPRPTQFGQVTIENAPCTGDEVAKIVRQLAAGQGR